MTADSNGSAQTRLWVYRFGGGTADGLSGDVDMLGAKGSGLAEMARLSMPVPPGFTVTTDACRYFFDHDGTLPPGLAEQAKRALVEIGLAMGSRFGDADNPLLLAVRPGAPSAVPGIMDPILDLGLNDATTAGLAKALGSEAEANARYVRFIERYAVAVLGLSQQPFEDTRETGDAHPEAFRRIVQDTLGKPFPQDVEEQLWGAIRAAFQSWTAARTLTYRRLYEVPEHWGVAISLQAMVSSGGAARTLFTRNPDTGEKGLVGIAEPGDDQCTIRAQLARHCERLERRHGDMQQVDYTVQDGQLWMLQTGPGKRTGKAAVRIAIDLADEGLISRGEAVLRIEPALLDSVLHAGIDPNADAELVAVGLPASPGAACGEIVFSAEAAQRQRALGRDVMLVRMETSAEDIHGMFAASGILTARGGTTSHAAVFARGKGRPCVTGAGGIRIDNEAGTLTAGKHVFKTGDVITIDGASGQVFKGRVPLRLPELSGDFAKLMSWADAERRMRIRTNAETPLDARQARAFGAEGIGLCRTENMFLEADRLPFMREMILADTEAGRRDALAKILPLQRRDFIELFEIMAGFPVTIRLLDPPLHEFLPRGAAEIVEAATALGVSPDKLKRRMKELHEFNPMLGFRGCRLGLEYPEIPEMQARAIFEAAIAAGQSTGAPVIPEIMVPLVVFAKELESVKALIDRTAAAVEAETGTRLVYQVGTMIELPRAALCADEIARSAEFFSFGTNDLTQTTLGLSRDDAAPILSSYLRRGIIDGDPFTSLDTDGVGELMAIAAERGRRTRRDLQLGLCGEHGGDPRSIDFCEATGLDYVSCSPYRVPVARLAAARAALARKMRRGA